MTDEPIKVGDTVYANFGRYEQIRLATGPVTSVTKTGRITADFGGSYGSVRFGVRGFRAGSFGACDRLIDKTEYDRLLPTYRQQVILHRVRQSIAKASRATASDKSDLIAHLEKALELARQLDD
jgi:hypothetical protein